MTVPSEDASEADTSHLRERLARELEEDGVLADHPEWHTAVETVPRHLFTPGFYLPTSERSTPVLPVQQVTIRSGPESAESWAAGCEAWANAERAEGAPDAVYGAECLTCRAQSAWFEDDPKPVQVWALNHTERQGLAHNQCNTGDYAWFSRPVRRNGSFGGAFGAVRRTRGDRGRAKSPGTANEKEVCDGPDSHWIRSVWGCSGEVGHT